MLVFAQNQNKIKLCNTWKHLHLSFVQFVVIGSGVLSKTPGSLKDIVVVLTNCFPRPHEIELDVVILIVVCNHI